MPILESIELTKRYTPFYACKGLSFSVERGESIGIVGESGCGKSTLAKILAKLTPRTSGDIKIDGRTIDSFTPRQLANEVQLIFQHSTLALNPKLTIRQILEEPLKIQGMPRAHRAEEALKLAQLPPHLLDRLPGQVSGGQRQRVNLLRALMLEPKILILDESLASQDDETKSHLVELLKELQWRHRLTTLVISHDLPLIEELTDRLFVMYAGQFVESGPTDEVAKQPLHPYTKALFAAQYERLPLLKGDFEQAPHKGCPLSRRCPFALAQCHTAAPPLRKLQDRSYRCHFEGL